jgi:catechol 2,3-dioxygenase-like lactoylglutathione lyase family enzyme
MKISMASITVSDQDKALSFYTTKLGFVKKADIQMGPLRWLTVGSPEGLDGIELILEKDDFPPARTYQQARFNAGIPMVAFTSREIQAEYRQLRSAGVTFRGEPQPMGPIISAVFEDGCGNLVNLVEVIAT